MDFNDTPEQAAFREAAADWLAANVPSKDEIKGMNRLEVAKLWQKRKYDAGWACIGWDPAYGGRGASAIEQVIWKQEEAKYDVPAGFFVIGQGMMAPTLMAYAQPQHLERYLPKLASGEEIWCQLFSEPAGGSDLAALRTKAEKDGDDYVLTGQKQFISGAGVSDVYIVMARTGSEGAKGISAFLIGKDTPGLSFGANEHKMGWNAQPTRSVNLDNARVPAANMLGLEGKGFNIAMSGLNGGRINIAACSLGGAQAALDASVKYLRDRKAFGKALIDQPTLQFRVADMATRIEVARSILWRAAASLDAKTQDATTLCAMAKQFVTDECFNVANDALQLHGGYGYLTEYGIEKIVRDLRVHQILEGTNEIMRLIVARSVTVEK